MILKGTKAQIVDPRTGFVLKTTKTSEWDALNHKLAVNNSILNCEENRYTVFRNLL